MIPLPDKVHIFETKDPSNSWDVPGIITAAQAQLSTGAYNVIYFEYIYQLITEPIPGYDWQAVSKYSCIVQEVQWQIVLPPQIRGRAGIPHHWTMKLRDLRQQG